MGSTSQFHGAYDKIPEEQTLAFRVDSSAKIPDMTFIRSPDHKQERMESL